MVEPPPARGLEQRLSDLRTRGPEGLAPLPEREEWSAASHEDRHRVLDELRVELYAISAIISDAAVRRIVADRSSFPPYGLARSKFSEFGMLSVFPDPYEEGSIGSFYVLWKAVVDTAVLHLHREISERRRSDESWSVERLARVLPAFAAAEREDKQPRKRDPMSFIYGGLQFGVSVCVQLIEVGVRVLQRDEPGLASDEQVAVLRRSIGPAYRLAVYNQEQALVTYSRLLSSASDTPAEGRERPGWLASDLFTVQYAHGHPWRVGLNLAELEEDPSADTGYRRLGCPARLTVEAEDTPIATLWTWCLGVARDTELLGPGAGGTRAAGPAER